MKGFMRMAQQGNVLKVVKKEQLKAEVKAGLKWARISFQDETNSVFVVFDQQPSSDQISKLLSDMGITKEQYQIVEDRHYEAVICNRSVDNGQGTAVCPEI